MSMKNVKKLLAAALAATMVFSVGVSAALKDEIPQMGYGEDATGSTDAEPEGIQPGTVFRYWSNYDIPAYSPWMDNRAAALSYQIYDNLLVKYKGNNQDIRPNIAESYEVSEDGLVYTFYLRKDVTFSNGNALTSADFIATWDVMQTYQPRPFSLVEKYEALDDYTLQVTLTSANPTFIHELPSQNIYGVVDHTAIEAAESPEDNACAVGCGPYYVEEYVSGERFVLKAREDYWNKERFPHVETCEIVIIPDETSAMMALMSGGVDCMNTVSTQVMSDLNSAGYRVALIEDRENPFWLNCAQVEVLKDIRVREALCHMIDWEEVTNLVYDGLYPHPNSYFTGEGLTEYSDKYDYDVERGLALLEEAGVSPEDIKFMILADPDFTNINVQIVSQFNEAGLTGITTETYDGATCYGMLKSGTYDCFPCHNGYDPVSVMTPFTMGLLEGGTQPCMFLKGVDDAAYDEAVGYYNEVAAATNLDDYYAAFHKLANCVQEQCLALGGVQVMRGYAFSAGVNGAYIAPVTSEIQMCHIWMD